MLSFGRDERRGNRSHLVSWISSSLERAGGRPCGKSEAESGRWGGPRPHPAPSGGDELGTVNSVTRLSPPRPSAAWHWPQTATRLDASQLCLRPVEIAGGPDCTQKILLKRLQGSFKTGSTLGSHEQVPWGDGGDPPPQRCSGSLPHPAVGGRWDLVLWDHLRTVVPCSLRHWCSHSVSQSSTCLFIPHAFMECRRAVCKELWGQGHEP